METTDLSTSYVRMTARVHCSQPLTCRFVELLTFPTVGSCPDVLMIPPALM